MLDTSSIESHVYIRTPSACPLQVNSFQSAIALRSPMDSALAITRVDNTIQHLRPVRAEDLPPTVQVCHVCMTHWGFPRYNADPPERPVLLPCGCIAGSSCLERSFEDSPRCPLCHTTVRVVAGVNAPLHEGAGQHLRQLERRSGVNDWPVPSIESRGETSDGAGGVGAGRMNYGPQDKLRWLNFCYDTFLSMRDLEICISLVDYRLGTTTSTVDLLDAFHVYPLFDLSRWKRTADIRHYLARKSTSPFQSMPGVEEVTGGDLRDVLMLVNIRAGTSFLLDELELVVSLMNHVHGTGAGLLDILGLRDGGLYGQSDLTERQVIDEGLVEGFGTLGIRVGSKNAVGDLGDVFSQATL